MGNKIFITGGVKSGKSSYALQIARKIEGRRVFIATAQGFDEEMKLRIERHKRERGDEFETIEEPIDLPKALENVKCDVAVIDCLTVWCGNLFFHDRLELVDEFVEAFKGVAFDTVVVSNEVGLGVIPENKLARNYVDILGKLNQQVARLSDVVVFMISGIPMFLKGSL